MSLVLAAAFLLPAIVGGLLAVAGRAADRLARPVSLLVAAATVALSVAAALLRPSLSVPFVEGGAFALRVDGLSGVLMPTVTGVALLVLVFAAAERTGPPARFHGLMLLFVAAVVVTVTATSLPALLAAWEVMGATSYALIGFVWQQPEKVTGGFVAFCVTRSADLGLYLAAGAAIAGGAGLSLSGLRSVAGPWLHVAAAGLLVAGLGKAAQLPFSFWLSRAMEGPSAVSALLHSAAMVAMGGYLLVRVAPLLAASGWAATTAAWIGAGTAVLLGAVAIGQRDLKQVLAASTASQLGFVVLAAGVGAVAGGTAQLVAHAATKALLFLCAGAWLTALGTKHLPALRGAARRWRVVGITFTIGAATLAGLPPLALWLTKDDVLAAALERSPALYGVGLVAAALSAAYATRVLVILWRRPTGEEEQGFDDEEQGSRAVPAAAVVPLVVLAAAAVAAVLLVVPPIADSLRTTVGAVDEPSSSPLELVVSAVLAVLVAAATARWAHAEPRWTVRWLGLERIAQLLIAGPVLATAHRLARFDDALAAAVSGHGGVDTVRATANRLGRFDDRLAVGVHGGAGSVRRLANAAADFDDRGLSGAMHAAGRWTAAAGRNVRRLQTGSLYQYYAAAVLAAVGLAVLLIVVR